MPGLSVSDNAMSSNKKMQIVEWICYHLQRNTFAELKFIDERQRKFQVPWVHKSNRRWNEKSAAVFKAWAEYKGKEENFSFTRAKTNFRMAMKCQAKIREVRAAKGSRGTKRRNSDEEMCVKVYEFVEDEKVEAKSKSKKGKPRRYSASSDCSSQDRCSPLTIRSLPSTSSQCQDNISGIYPEDVFASPQLTEVPAQQAEVSPQQAVDNFSFEQEFLAFSSDATNPFEIKDLLPEDGDIIRLPSCQELLTKRLPTNDFLKPSCDTRYTLLYDSISDMEVPSSDYGNYVNSSPGSSSDDSIEENLSLYDHTRWSQDLDSHCQVANYTDSCLEYCFSDSETWERMENALEQLLIRSFC